MKSSTRPVVVYARSYWYSFLRYWRKLEARYEEFDATYRRIYPK
ncbi:MAG: hypothetical protein WC052_00385 [Patescibacteria group bacterium]